MRSITTTFAMAFCIASFATFRTASAATEFPQIDSSAYCQELISKMLDKAEQSREMAQCLSFEATSRARLNAEWRLVSPAGSKECLKPANRAARSYVYLEFCIATDLGFQCLRGDLKCEPKS